MRPEKKQLVQDIREFLEPSASAFLITYKGLSVAEMSELRAGLAEKGTECHVVPNRLFKIAAREAGIDALADVPLEGDTAVVSGGGDPAQVAKVLSEFSSRFDQLTFKAGVLEEKAVSVEEIKQLAILPPLDVLRAQLLGVLNAPKQQLVSVLNAKVASILYALQAYLDKKENQS